MSRPTLTLRPFPFRGPQDPEEFNAISAEITRDITLLAYTVDRKEVSGLILKGQTDYIGDNYAYMRENVGSGIGGAPTNTQFGDSTTRYNLIFAGFEDSFTDMHTLLERASNMGHSAIRGEQ